MPRPEFSQAGTNGGGQTIAVNQRPKLHTLNLSQTREVVAGDTSTTEIYAPQGSTYQIEGAFLQVSGVPSSGSGRHTFDLKPMGSLISLRGVSSYSDELRWQFSHWSSATQTKLPADESAAMSAMRDLRATDSKPITVTYFNDTDSTQTEQRTIKFVVSEASY